MTEPHTHRVRVPVEINDLKEETFPCAEGPSCLVERLKEAEELIRDSHRYLVAIREIVETGRTVLIGPGSLVERAEAFLGKSTGVRKE